MNSEREITLKMMDKVLDLAVAISFQLKKDLPKVQMYSIEGVVSMLHKRIHSNMITIRMWVADDKNLSPISPSIVYRAIALDYMILLYLKIQKNKFEGTSYVWKGLISENLQKEIENLLNDQLKRFYKDAFELIGVEFKDEKEYNDFIKIFKNQLPSKYHSINKDTKEYNFYSPKDLFRELKKLLPADEFNTNLKTIWDFYMNYSKIDHFGIISMISENIPLDTFIRQLRLAMLYILDAFSIIGVDFMGAETFAKMWLQTYKDISKMS